MFRQTGRSGLSLLAMLSLLALSPDGRCAPVSRSGSESHAKAAAKAQAKSQSKSQSKSQAKSDGPSEMVWVARQKTSMVGPQTLYISKNAFKIDMSAVNVCLLVVGPKWHVTMFNYGTRRYVDIDPKEAHSVFSYQRAPHMSKGEAGADETPLMVGKSQVLGHPVTEYVYPHNPTYFGTAAVGKRLTALTEKGVKLTGRDKKLFDRAMQGQRREFWVAKDIAVPEQVARIFGVDPDIAASLYLPMRMIQVSSDGHRAVAIDTISLRHEMQPVSIFAHPVGYKKAANQMAVLMEDSSEEEVDMFGGAKKGAGGDLKDTVRRAIDKSKGGGR